MGCTQSEEAEDDVRGSKGGPKPPDAPPPVGGSSVVKSGAEKLATPAKPSEPALLSYLPDDDGSITSKIIIVGDGAIGKTCLLQRIMNEDISWDGDDAANYDPTTFNTKNIEWEHNTVTGCTKAIELEVYDTAGQEGFENLRLLSYPGTDIFIIGFSCESEITITNVVSKWLPEITDQRLSNGEEGEPWIVLVGTKKDLREKHGKGVDAEQEKAIAEEVNACALVDTSAKTPDEEEAGIAKLKLVIKALACMKDAGVKRPNWEDWVVT